MAEIPDLGGEPVPGTPRIREIRSDPVPESFGFCPAQQNAGNQGTRKVGLRAEIDTSPPFGSVQEAVTRFGGRGSWMPYYKGFEEMDIKKVEEQAAELEKDLIVKELETLDVLEELGTTKRIVEELKLQLQKEALRCMSIPDDHVSSPASIKEMNKENCSLFPAPPNTGGVSSPRHHPPTSSPDMILMELKQAKLNLGKTINDLGVIQSSVESLNKKMKKEKTFLQKTRKRLTSKFAGVLSLEEELKQARVQPPPPPLPPLPQQQQMAEAEKTMLTNEQTKSTCLKTAELRLVAAKKMEEAAKATEAVALAEIKALSGNNEALSSGFVLPLPEPERVASFEARSPLVPFEARSPLASFTSFEAQSPLVAFEARSPLASFEPRSPFLTKPEVFAKKVEVPKPPKRDPNAAKMSILKKMREATEEVKQSKQALEDALNKVEMANRKQFAAEEAIRKWIPDNDQESQATYYAPKFANYHLHQPEDHQDSVLHETKGVNLVPEDPKPVLRTTVSMRDVLSRKQVLPEEYVMARPVEAREDRQQKVALSQMLHELREDLTFHPRPEKDAGEPKQFIAQRRKFGFIHISLPMSKPSKKKAQDFSNNQIH
ncbi:WEB family protein At2g40480 isoform X2 [Euphorbia lathyris]|uniref:WEB family protein At2g40480 isoform X2 n=1 Tax=Euphorbia lathyris TaxID=212925 RepID=UPI00331353DF